MNNICYVKYPGFHLRDAYKMLDDSDIRYYMQLPNKIVKWCNDKNIEVYREIMTINDLDTKTVNLYIKLEFKDKTDLLLFVLQWGKEDIKFDVN